MDNEKLTTRKGFFQKAGLALAGTFMLSAASRPTIRAAGAAEKTEFSGSPSNPFDRIRPARGTVQRKI